MAEQTQPRERVHKRLYLAYQWWYEISELKKKHTLRINSKNRGASDLDAEFEQDMLNQLLKPEGSKVNFETLTEKDLLDAAKDVPCFEWATSFRGFGNGKQVAKILALIDDITRFPTVSKFWRYCGYGVFQYWVSKKGEVFAPKQGYKMVNEKRTFITPDAKNLLSRDYHLEWIVDRALTGWTLPYHKMLKSSIFMMMQVGVVQHRTDVYRDYYDQIKDDYTRKHPEPVKVGKRTNYTKKHIDLMTYRKVAKLWLQHLWVVWRTELGLPVTKPWIHTVGRHSHYIAPPHYDVSKIRYE